MELISTVLYVYKLNEILTVQNSLKLTLKHNPVQMNLTLFQWCQVRAIFQSPFRFPLFIGNYFYFIWIEFNH